MGGPGSGNWYRYNRKQTVEDSITLSLSSFLGRIRHGYRGTVTWTRPNGSVIATIGFRITIVGHPTIMISYRRNDEEVDIPVDLQTTATQFGGRRYWFTCPLIVNGVPCERRAGKLHLPPGWQYFGCRKCHKLTYRSSQEAHLLERALVQSGIDFDPEIHRMMQRGKS